MDGPLNPGMNSCEYKNLTTGFAKISMPCGYACLETHVCECEWGRGGVVVSALDFRSEGQWFEAQSLPLRCFLRLQALPHIVSLHQGVQNGYRRHIAGGNPAMD